MRYLLVIFCLLHGRIWAQQSFEFLIGDWTIERIYGPEEETPRLLNGSMKCRSTMDSTYINCTYVFLREDKPDVIDEVYLNYNNVYDNHESLWLSATWPIKVNMQGKLSKERGFYTYECNAEFPIGNGVTEYVKSEQIFDSDEQTFIRNTHLHTSNEEEWKFHMKETATRSN